MKLSTNQWVHASHGRSAHDRASPNRTIEQHHDCSKNETFDQNKSNRSEKTLVTPSFQRKPSFSWAPSITWRTRHVAACSDRTCANSPSNRLISSS